MDSVIRKWGNSPALRLPKSLLSEAGLGVDQRVRLSAVEGSIRVERLRTKPVYRLEALLAKASKRNQHDETEWGAARGHEAW
jgi:antitoxin MazE